jgi:hypothetical protein
MIFKLSDAVAMRMIQIFQEAALFGIDGADLFRQVRLTTDESDPEVLVLDADYKRSVGEMHEKYISEIEGLQEKARQGLIIEGSGEGGSNN